MHKVDLNLFPILLALYDELSVSRAARELSMSQPAVSMALRKMRGTFNDPLFVRAAKGMTPTPRAHALVAVARPLVTRVQEGVLAEEEFDPGASTRPFTFALSDVGEMVFLPKLLERLREQAPNAPVRSVSMPPHQIVEGLEEGEIDLTLGYFPDLNRQSFFQQRLFTHHFACLMRAVIRIARSGSRRKRFSKWNMRSCTRKVAARKSSRVFSIARRFAGRSCC